MSRLSRTLSLLIAIPLLLIGFAGCASSDAEPEVAVPDDAIVLDVRTPEEYAEGHLEGAQLLDLNSGDLQAAIPELDPDAEYYVYCRSGNRSGQATALLEQVGFTHVIDLGAMEDAASATGIEIVTD